MNQQVQTLLEQLAHSLGTTIQYLWGVEIRQAYIVGIENLVWSVFLMVATYAAIRIVKKCFHAVKVLNDYDSEEETYFDDDGVYILIASLVSASCIVIAICMLCDLNSGINELINPAHFVIQDISSFVKSGSK